MTRCVVAKLCLSTVAVASAVHHWKKDPLAYGSVQCEPGVISVFENASEVLRSNPGGLLDWAKTVQLEVAGGNKCLYRPDSTGRHTFVRIDENCEPITTCCSWDERLGMGSDVDGNLLPFAADAFAAADVFTLSGVEYTQIKPDTCPAGGCPLVVEIPGNAGNPWLMARNACKDCHAKLGVVILSPSLGAAEDTGLSWTTSTFIPFVRQYLATYTSLVDEQRVYLVTASRGNEIGLTAALAEPSMWSYLLMTGKFQFTADIQGLVQTAGIWEKSRAAGLKKIDINVGDQDPILPDEEFYSNISLILKGVSTSQADATMVVVNIYPWQEHDTSPGVWSKRSDLIWAGIRDP